MTDEKQSDAVEPWDRYENPLEDVEWFLRAAEEELGSPALRATSEGHKKTIAACRRLVEIAQALRAQVERAPALPPWEDRLLDSAVKFGPLLVWIDEAAEGWRIHASLRPWVIAPRGASREETKRAAEQVIAAVVTALREVQP